MEGILIYYDEKAAGYMERMVRRLAYGDALVSDEGLIRTFWRLEYIDPGQGEVHYRLYHAGQTVGVQYVRAASWLSEVQRKLGAYLTILGFTPQNTSLIMGGARTKVSDEHNRLPHLFKFDFEHQQPEEDDLEALETNAS